MLWGEKRLRTLENRMVRRIFRPEIEEVTGNMRNCKRKNLICTLQKGQSSEGR
jgi:hypothetical protein